MIDVLKRALYTGAGIASLTREKLVELGEEISRQAELSESQAKELQEELIRKGAEAKHQFDSQIDQRVELVLSRLGVARNDQVDQLKARIATLEQQIQALQTHEP